MSGTNLEPWVAVQGALKDHMRERDCRFKRVADRVRQQAAAGEPPAWLQFARAERVHKNEDAEFLGLRPHRMEFRVCQLLSGDAATDRETSQPQILDPIFELLDREL